MQNRKSQEKKKWSINLNISFKILILTYLKFC